MKIFLLKIISVLLFLFLTISKCIEDPNDKLYGIITYKTGNAFVNNASARLGDIIKKNDTIRVRDKSILVIQFSSSALLTINPNTKLKITGLMNTDNGKSLVKLCQVSGSTYSKVIKGRADYCIKTPTLAAAVCGTSFYIYVQKYNSCHLQLLHGKVNVMPSIKVKELESVILNNSEQVEITADGFSIVRSLSESDKKDLKKMDEITILSSDKLEEEIFKTKSNIMSGEVEKIILEYEMKNNIPDKEFSISYLKRKYGKLSKIRTKYGKIYTGTFKQTGKSMDIISTEGRLSLPISTVEKISVY